MALTRNQAEAVMRLFALNFSKEADAEKRKKLFLQFEDDFGHSISYWKTFCEKIVQEKRLSEEVLKHFRTLASRNLERSCDYLVRSLKKDDLEEVFELINRNFDMTLTIYDMDKIEPFLESGYSFVVCNNEEILGAVLGYKMPDLVREYIYIDTIVVGETVRNMGLGRMLISHVEECASKNHIHLIRLQTDKEIEAYEIYKHMEFTESSLVTMKRFFM